MIVRRLPPCAAPVTPADVLAGIKGAVRPGPALMALEREMASALGVQTVVLVSSGRAALTLALRVLAERSPHRRVILPAYTCFSVAAAIVKAGCEPVPCDVDPETFDFDFANLEGLLAEGPTLAVVSTHLLGRIADVARTRALCRDRGVVVIEDAAQAFGFETPAGTLGTLGDVGFFSFGRGKAVTCGSGGCLVTNDPALGEALRQAHAALERPAFWRGWAVLVEVAAMSVLLHPRLYWLPASLPFLRLGETVYSTDFAIEQLSGAQAGLLRYWQARLRAWNDARRARTAALDGEAGRGREAMPTIRYPVVCASRAERDALYAAATREGLGFSLMYPTSIPGIPELNGRVRSASCPNADALAARLLTVPVHPLVSDADRTRIAELLARRHEAA